MMGEWFGFMPLSEGRSKCTAVRESSKASEFRVLILHNDGGANIPKEIMLMT